MESRPDRVTFRANRLYLRFADDHQDPAYLHSPGILRSLPDDLSYLGFYPFYAIPVEMG